MLLVLPPFFKTFMREVSASEKPISTGPKVNDKINKINRVDSPITVIMTNLNIFCLTIDSPISAHCNSVIRIDKQSRCGEDRC